VTFTVYPPDGSAPVVVSQQIQYSGDSDPMQVAVNQIIPYYNGMYFYDINVTNSCGALFSFDLLNMPAFFDLNAEPVAETCYENGEIIAMVEGASADAVVDYVIYKMPDETTPIATGEGDPGVLGHPYLFEGLDSGDYKVVATQTLGTETTTAIQIVTIDDDSDPVTTETTTVTDYILCGNDGIITITLQQGTAESYELFQQQPDGTFLSIAGPQVSNVFTDLTGGVYAIGILD